MQGVYAVDEIRAAEDALMARLPDGALMARAAQGLAIECAHAARAAVYGARVVLLVGAGNNGGDALYAGAALARRGAQVTAVLLAPTGRTRAGWPPSSAPAAGSAAPRPCSTPAVDLVVDGMVGIGGRGGLRPAAVPLAAAARAVPTVAVDIPSGVDADTGGGAGDSVHADVTVTFGALKPGLVVGAGVERAGEVRLVDIGLAATLPAAAHQVLEAADVAALLPTPGRSDDKYTRGVVGLVAGSAAYPGAGVLAPDRRSAAVRAWCATRARRSRRSARAYPEVVVDDGARPGDAARAGLDGGAGHRHRRRRPRPADRRARAPTSR